MKKDEWQDIERAEVKDARECGYNMSARHDMIDNYRTVCNKLRFSATSWVFWTHYMCFLIGMVIMGLLCLMLLERALI